MHVSGRGAIIAVAAGILLGVNTAHAAAFEEANSGDQHKGGSPAGLTVLNVDNANADSWLEVDRAGNVQTLSRGDAGSDHEGDDGAADDEMPCEESLSPEEMRACGLTGEPSGQGTAPGQDAGAGQETAPGQDAGAGQGDAAGQGAPAQQAPAQGAPVRGAPARQGAPAQGRTPAPTGPPRAAPPASPSATRDTAPPRQRTAHQQGTTQQATHQGVPRQAAARPPGPRPTTPTAPGRP
jgi:hypothetical protein